MKVPSRASTVLRGFRTVDDVELGDKLDYGVMVARLQTTTLLLRSFVFPRHGLHWGLTRSSTASSHLQMNYCETRLCIT